MLQLALRLSQGMPSDTVVSTAKVKPKGELGRRVLAEFSNSHLGAGARTLEALDQNLDELTHSHPWFGPLTASDWIRLAAAHARIHQRQLEHILKAAKLTA